MVKIVLIVLVAISIIVVIGGLISLLYSISKAETVNPKEPFLWEEYQSEY